MLGAWLMNTWLMPKPIIDIVYHHHNPCYRGDNYQLNLLTFLSDCLLAKIGIGDGRHQFCPDEVFTQLQLSDTTCSEILDKHSDAIESITATAGMLSE
jgi:HD-like signal output (HDOD) protein